MAQLGSPGVQVNVIDESFYNPATPGTVPLVVLATSQNKKNASSSGIAAGTTMANANALYLATSQKDLLDQYGLPEFEKDSSGNAIQGSELNEYGLFAAYSYLSASNSAYILRAGVDLASLKGRASAPVGNPASNSWWFDLSKSRFGVFEWNDDLQRFASKTPLVLNSTAGVVDNTDYKPKSSVGSTGDYAVVTYSDPNSATQNDSNTLWYKNRDGNWVKVGSKNSSTPYSGTSFAATDWSSSWPIVSTNAFTALSLSAVSYSNVPATGGQGNGAVFNVTRQNGVYTVTASVSGTGTGYANGNTLTIPGNLVGGVAPDNNITIIVDGLSVNGTIFTANFTAGNGGVTGTASNVSSKGMKLTVGAWGTALGSGTVLNFNIDGGTALSGGGFGATPTEVATGLNALFSGASSPVNKVFARVRDGKVEIVSKENVYVKIEALAGDSSNTLADLGLTAGTFNSPVVQFSEHTKIPFWSTGDTANGYSNERPSGSVWVKTTEFNLGAKWTVKKFNGDALLFESKEAPVYVGTADALAKLDPVGGGINLAVNTLFVNANYEQDTDANFRLMYRAGAGTSSAFVSGALVSGFSSSAETLTIAETSKATSTLNSVTVALSLNDNINAVVTKILAQVNSSGLKNVEVLYDSVTAKLTLRHKLGGDIFLSGNTWTTLGFANSDNVYSAPSGSVYEYVISNWKPLSVVGYAVDNVQPSSNPADGTLWYASYQNQVDIMVHDGSKWVGYRNFAQTSGSNPAGPFVQATRPTQQSDGTALEDGDLWVDTSVSDNYGRSIKRWNSRNQVWDPIDVTDHTSQFGIIFADARWSTAGSDPIASPIVDLLSSNYVDPDAPDPTAYPRGMLLWNTRRSGFNIKQYKRNYIDTSLKNTRFADEPMGSYTVDRWVSVSGQDLNQVAYFGRKAQRAYVVGQLKVAINTNQRILDEDNVFFNLIACPGYPELISDMVNLNNSRNGTALIIGDTPMRLASNANSLVNYGTDAVNSGIDGEDGLHTNSDHLAVYYPSGLTTDLSGMNVVVPASHMMLRTIAISDQRSFQWFAPAGTRRGGITNATSVGYLKDGSFIPVSLNQATRDQMAVVKINPITNIPGAGLVAFGQYTKTGVNSSLDRINVSRLVSYLRRQLGIITKPFLFEPNDKQTRSEVKNVCESLLLDLVSLRGVYDFIVVCDETNNTPSVISNNQLYVDIAVEPVKAVEFIYIPLRLKNVGDIKARQ